MATFNEEIDFWVQWAKDNGVLTPTPNGIARLHFEAMDISPERAKILLMRNTNNRKLTEKRYREYAQDMLKGRWNSATGEAIGMSPEGVLVNGQHRLNAVVVSGKTIRFTVCFGITQGAANVMDAGKPRTAEGNLQRMGYKFTNEWARFAIAINNYHEGVGISFVNKLTIDAKEQQMLDCKDDFYEAIDNVPHDMFKGLPLSIRCIAYHILKKKSKEAAKKFLFHMVIGTELANGNPILLHRAWIISNSSQTAYSRDTEGLRRLLITWNQWRNNQLVRTYRKTTGWPTII